MRIKPKQGVCERGIEETEGETAWMIGTWQGAVNSKQGRGEGETGTHQILTAKPGVRDPSTEEG